MKKEIDWSYVGGFIDADGSVVDPINRPSGMIVIVNTEKGIIDTIKKFLDKNYVLCTVCKVKSKQQKHHKDVYHLTINGKTAIRQIRDKCPIFHEKKRKRLSELNF